MNVQKAPIAYIDRLPDELLLNILELAVTRSAPFYPEYCIKVLRGRHGGEDKPEMSLDTAPRGLLNAVRGYQLLRQLVHLNDWRALNGTNRRFRRMAVEAFFGAKTIMMTVLFPQMVRRGELPGVGPALNRGLVLKYIRSVALVHRRPGLDLDPAFSEAVPALLRSFPRLKDSMIVLGESHVSPMPSRMWFLDLQMDSEGNVRAGGEARLASTRNRGQEMTNGKSQATA
ncbi:hypothetical protein SAMD00023353_1301590 [Rosellinia necatrix]|uniref:Uncharacterized protein n=1 Tax=Rosellinia necatrix TaxID=77044 RepID=A0A1W2TCB2_ROSNE|nr:hypothetical protein SAMD00023353_1301590 [Rosellinia necatrix]